MAKGKRKGRIVFAWELGGGLGHLARIAPVASGLLAEGHEVAAFVPDPGRAEPFLPGVERIAAPPLPARAERAPAANFAEVLAEAGFAEPHVLAGRADAWRAALSLAAPDVLVFDHAPTALLASRGLEIPRVLLTTGFALPPDTSPLPSLLPDVPTPAEPSAAETRALAAANAWADARGVPEMPRLASLFAEVEAAFVAGWPELDHYGARPSLEYLGPWPGPAAPAPDWPAGSGVNVFAYLKPFPRLPALIEILHRSGLPSLVVVEGAEEALARELSRGSVKVGNAAVAIEAAARKASVAVTHAGHGTTGALLRCGTPILAIPLVVEQLLVARRIVALHAGLVASADAPQQMIDGLKRLIEVPRFSAAARRFAGRRAAEEPAESVAKVVARIGALASPRPNRLLS